MAQSVVRFLIGRNLRLAGQILAISGLLTLTAFGTLALPALWERLGDPVGTTTMQYAAAGAFILSVVAAIYILSDAGDVNPWLPTGAVLLVLTGYGVTGVVDGPELLFLIGPSLLLGVLAALAGYANDGAFVAFSLVLFPVFGYMVNAPYGPIAQGDIVVRLQLSLLFSLLFTFAIGTVGFLLGVLINRVQTYSGDKLVSELQHPDEISPKHGNEQTDEA